MSHKNTYLLPSEEEEKKIREAVEKIQEYQLKPLFQKLFKIWLFILFVIFSFLFTVVASVELALSIWR